MHSITDIIYKIFCGEDEDVDKEGGAGGVADAAKIGLPVINCETELLDALEELLLLLEEFEEPLLDPVSCWISSAILLYVFQISGLGSIPRTVETPRRRSTL